MNIQSRIPKLNSPSFDGALFWFAELQTKGLLFHPEDDPADIVLISDGTPAFSDAEVTELRAEFSALESSIGHDALIEAAYPIFVRSFGLRLDS